MKKKSNYVNWIIKQAAKRKENKKSLFITINEKSNSLRKTLNTKQLEEAIQLEKKLKNEE